MVIKPFIRIVAAVAILCGLCGAGAWAQGGGEHIATGDLLKITTWNEPTLSASFPVGPDGMVDFPLIGRVKAEGLTPLELAQTLRSKLIDGGFVLNPQITIDMEQSPNKHLNVLGEIRAPGVYPFGGEMTLLDVLARAGGTTEAAGDIARLCHSTSGASTAVATADASDSSASTTDPADACDDVDLHELMIGSRKDNVPIHDGDTLIVPKIEPVFVTGFVKARGAYAVQRGTTVLQVITLAGGPDAQGKMNGITILRKVAGKKDLQKISVKDPKTQVVEPGDTINVPKSFFGGGN